MFLKVSILQTIHPTRIWICLVAWRGCRGGVADLDSQYHGPKPPGSYREGAAKLEATGTPSGPPMPKFLVESVELFTLLYYCATWVQFYHVKGVTIVHM